MPESDELLVHKSIRGDAGSFGIIVERYHHQIFDLALKAVNHREDSRDITQEVFIRAFNSLPAFRYESTFRTWLYRIASNTIVDHLRRRSRESAGRSESAGSPAGDGVESIPSGGPGPEESLIRAERRSEVRKALESLPESYRIPLIMQHYRGMSYREISAALNIPEKTVATRLYRAKSQLKTMLLGGERGEVPGGEKKAGRPAGPGVQAL